MTATRAMPAIDPVDGVALALAPVLRAPDLTAAPGPVIARPTLRSDGAAMRVDLPLDMPGLGRDHRRFTLTPARLWTQTQHYVDSLTGFDVTLSAEPTTRRVEVSVSARVQSRRRTLYRGDFAYAAQRPPMAFGQWDEIDPGMLGAMRRDPPARCDAATAPRRWVEEDRHGAADACAALGAEGFIAGAAGALRRLCADLGVGGGSMIYAFGVADDAADGLGRGLWVCDQGRAGWFGPAGDPTRGVFGAGARPSACLAVGPDFAAARAAFGDVEAGRIGGWRWLNRDGCAIAATGPQARAAASPEFAATALAWLHGRGRRV